jgi:hypothetical protein
MRMERRDIINEKGELHRTHGPAVERAVWRSTFRSWYLNGKRHRTDGPAVEYANGTKEWYLNGKLHRTDGPAVEREWISIVVFEWKTSS